MIVLKRGDRIHLAFPVDSSIAQLPSVEQGRIAQKTADQLTAVYARQGVEVVFWSGNINLTHPVVVAVFRDSE